MGTLISSFNKSRNMKKLIILMSRKETTNFDEIDKHQQEELVLFEKLLDSMKSMGGFLEATIESFNTNPYELRNISHRIHFAGYDYYKNDYLPIALISFASTLDFILYSKDEILLKGIDEIKAVVEEAKLLL